MTPIEKNVIVVDELGNEYEATYPKRAKGLVKNGRARFIDENTICLACPPNTELEDMTMSENKTVNTTVSEKTTEATATEQSAVKIVPTPISVSYVLEKIEQIAEDREYIHKALEQLALMPKSDPGDIAGQEKAKAIGDIVRCRETTNQQALRLYEKMYDDLKPKNEKGKALDILAEFVKTCNFDSGEDSSNQLAYIFDIIRHLT